MEPPRKRFFRHLCLVYCGLAPLDPIWVDAKRGFPRRMAQEMVVGGLTNVDGTGGDFPAMLLVAVAADDNGDGGADCGGKWWWMRSWW